MWWSPKYEKHRRNKNLNKENENVSKPISEIELLEWAFIYGKIDENSQFLYNLDFIIKEYMKKERQPETLIRYFGQNE